MILYNSRFIKLKQANNMIIDNILKEWSSALDFFELKKYGLIFRKGGICLLYTSPSPRDRG